MEGRDSWTLRRFGRFASGVFLLATAAHATDYYVDAVNGSNANAGTSPAAPWLTITHALTTLPVPSGGVAHTLHVAPGTYDRALGESFPLLLMGHDALDIVGDGGAAVTILDGEGFGTLVIDMPNPPTLPYPWNTGPLTRMRGLTLDNADIGLLLASANSKSTDLTCMDMRITRMRHHAVEALGFGGGFQAKDLTAIFERVEVRDCQNGFLVETRGTAMAGHARVKIVDSTIEACRGTGVHVADQELGTHGSRLELLRTRVQDNGQDGVLLAIAFTSSQYATVTEIQECLIARNGAAGVRVAVDSGTWGSVLTHVRRSTIVDNAGHGLRSFVPPPISPPMTVETTLTGSILWGNGDDVDDNPAWPTLLQPTSNDIEDGDFAGVDGNIAIAPLFRDAPNGDWRLVWGSPCVDAGEQGSFPADSLDLAGANRVIDGNLDALRRCDMGAFEFAPLWPTGAAHLGMPLALEQWGPAGSSAHLLAARGLPREEPFTTPYGDLFVNRAYVRNLGAGPVAPGPPALRVLPIPSDPIYVGQIVTFQALVTPTAATAGSAFTNAAWVTITP